MSLRSKIALMLFTAVSVYVGLDHVLRRLNFSGRVQELEQTRAMARYERVEASLDALASDLEEVAKSFSSVAEPEALETMLGVGAPPLVVVIDGTGRVHYQRVRDPHTGAPATLRELPNERLAPAHPLLWSWLENKSVHGLWVNEWGAVLVAGATQQLPGGDSRCLIVGRPLDAGMLENIRGRVDSDLEVFLAQGNQLSEEQFDVLALASESDEPVLEELGDSGIRVWGVLPDLTEHPAMLVRMDVPLELSELWADIDSYALTSTLALAVLFPLVILLLLQWIVTGPLSQLTAHAVSIGRAQDTDARLRMKRKDEIGVLAEEFDGMLEQLARSREQVVHNARLAGMSEVSAGVLHNVGNVLNSANVATFAADRLARELKIKDLRVIVDELDSHEGELDAYLGEDLRGRHLMRYFRRLVDELESGRVGISAELEAVDEKLGSVANLISALGSTGDRLGVHEDLDLSEQVDAALELCVRSLDLADSLQVARFYYRVPTVRLDRHKLIEALVNLILNALDSMRLADPKRLKLELRVECEDDDVASIEIADNGVGIPEEDLTRMFSLGFSTKPNGRGLGLHLAALSVREMNGSLSGHSDGLGTGARFRLRLPLREGVSATDTPELDEVRSLVDEFEAECDEVSVPEEANADSEHVEERG